MKGGWRVRQQLEKIDVMQLHQPTCSFFMLVIRFLKNRPSSPPSGCNPQRFASSRSANLHPIQFQDVLQCWGFCPHDSITSARTRRSLTRAAAWFAPFHRGARTHSRSPYPAHRESAATSATQTYPADMHPTCVHRHSVSRDGVLLEHRRGCEHH